MQRLIICLFFLLVSGHGRADEIVIKDQEKKLAAALAAEGRGDIKTAYAMWTSLADQGDYKAAVTEGLMHHEGRGMPVDYVKAMDWYLKAFQHNADAMNNIGVLYREGQGVPQNKKIAYLLFLSIHMTGMGGEETVMRANGNLRQSIAGLEEAERQEALCYTFDYVTAYIESKGTQKKTAEEIRQSANTKRIRDFGWWAPGEVGDFECPAGT